MYVKVTTTRAGKKTYRYLSLVESYREGGRVRQRTVARLGEATAMAASGELANIVGRSSEPSGWRPPWVAVGGVGAFFRWHGRGGGLLRAPRSR